MRVNVIYEEIFPYNIQKVYDRTLQWLGSQYKAIIKKTSPPTYIEAKQGTMMTNTGHDPNWKKRIKISFYELEESKTRIRVEATPLARNILRVEKLRRSWYEGLFIHLFSIFRTDTQSKLIEKIDPRNTSIKKYCTNCGRRLEDNIIICPTCGIDIA